MSLDFELDHLSAPASGEVAHVLVDTSVWIDHFRRPNADLELLLDEGRVSTHPFVIARGGETEYRVVRITVTSDDGVFDSGDLASGQTFSFAFDKPGTYWYFCRPHPFMRGRVVVATAAPTPTDTTP